MGMTNEELTDTLQRMIDATEKRMVEMWGMQLYKKPDGFTQEDIYTLCGRDDSVTTISLKPDSDGYLAYGEDVTVCFVYTSKERKLLEKDPASLNETPCVKARALLPDYDTSKVDALLNVGVNTQDIVQLLVLPGTKPENRRRPRRGNRA